MITHFTDADVPSQAGKTIFVTGANTGIGFEAAKVVAGKGARTLLGCRTRSKAEDAKARILEAHPKAEVELIDLDLADFDSVRSAAGVVAEEARLDVLINNAGLMMPPRHLTKQGFESQFGVNHLGPFLLTSLLLPLLEKTEGSRIVNTSSNGHRMGDIDFDDLAAEKSYSSLNRYGASKLANLLHTYELDRRLRAKGSNTISVAVHPGGTDTDLMRHLPSMLVTVLRPVLYPVLNQPPQGAWPTLAGATAPGVEGGQYFGPRRFGQLSGPAKRVTSNTKSHDPALAKRLWDLSIELTGTDPGL